jgi:sucrose-6-phosphatase
MPVPPSRILATDLDGTLVGNRQGLARLKEVLAAHAGRWYLVYATGRTMAQGRRLAEDEGLPEPDAWVTEVGAAITYRGGRVDEDWRSRMAAHWDRDVVARTARQWAELTPQPPEADGPFKVPFYVEPAAAAEIFPVLDARLREAGTPARLVYSSQRDLDIVPEAAGKAAAMRHLMAHFGVQLADMLACGDSANDRDMLCLGGPAVAVGNAHAELTEAGLPTTVLRARGHAADGILEALAHYRWIEPDSRAVFEAKR